MAKLQKAPKRYGIAEIGGELFNTLSNKRRGELIDAKMSDVQCRFFASAPSLAPKGKRKKDGPRVTCNKKSKICSIRNYLTSPRGKQSFGSITVTCPIRFYEDYKVFEKVSELLLGDKNARIVKEIPFLKRPHKERGPDTDGEDSEIEGGDKEDVGRIDMVMVSEKGPIFDWCAVEIQAVYFSGDEFAKDYPVIKSYRGKKVPEPTGKRRPDFRSCGPKRLMPQLQTKVPTLRRWGKKLAVIVDEPFFDALGEMDNVEDLSNCDIVWFIIGFDERAGSGKAKLKIKGIRYTTLERAVEGLTAGVPTTLIDFENKIRVKLGS